MRFHRPAITSGEKANRSGNIVQIANQTNPILAFLRFAALAAAVAHSVCATISILLLAGCLRTRNCLMVLGGGCFRSGRSERRGKRPPGGPAALRSVRCSERQPRPQLQLALSEKVCPCRRNCLEVWPGEQD